MNHETKLIVILSRLIEELQIPLTTNYQPTTTFNSPQKELGVDLGTDYFPNPYDGYQMHTQANISTSKDNLGFEPKISLEQGIKSYITEIKRLHGTEII